MVTNLLRGGICCNSDRTEYSFWAGVQYSNALTYIDVKYATGALIYGFEDKYFVVV